MMPCALLMSALAKPCRWQFFGLSGTVQERTDAEEIVKLNQRIRSLEQDRDNKSVENLQMAKKVILFIHLD